MIRTGEQYLDSIRDGRKIYIADELVTDPTSHPAFENIAQTYATLYDLKADPALSDKILIEYFSANGTGPTQGNAAGNIVKVSVRNYQAPLLVSPMLFALPDFVTLSVSSVDKMEPFPGTPPARM